MHSFSLIIQCIYNMNTLLQRQNPRNFTEAFRLLIFVCRRILQNSISADVCQTQKKRHRVPQAQDSVLYGSSIIMENKAISLCFNPVLFVALILSFSAFNKQGQCKYSTWIYFQHLYLQSHLQTSPTTHQKSYAKFHNNT